MMPTLSHHTQILVVLQPLQPFYKGQHFWSQMCPLSEVTLVRVLCSQLLIDCIRHLSFSQDGCTHQSADDGIKRTTRIICNKCTYLWLVQLSMTGFPGREEDTGDPPPPLPPPPKILNFLPKCVSKIYDQTSLSSQGENRWNPVCPHGSYIPPA